MGDALSKPAEEAAEGGQQAGSSVVQRACQIQVTPCRVKPAGGGGSTHRPVPPSSQQEQQASAGTKRKALEPAVGDDAIIKRQQLTGLTLLTQCALTAAQHDEVATEVEDVLPSRKEQQLGGAELGGPLHASPACQQAAITAQKAGHIAAKSAPMLEGSEEAHQRVIPLAPFFAAKPISRAQLRQQLQLNSRCFPAAAAATPSLVSCAPPVGAVAAKVSRTTRGQRLLGLARRQQWQHQQEQPAFSPSATVAVADEARMDLDEVPPSRSRAQPGHVTAGRLLAQRRLTQSRCSLAGAAAATDGTCPNSAQAAEVGHPRSTQLPPGGSTPDQLPRTMPPTPATAEPRGNSWPAQAASLTLLPDSALQSPPQEEGAVQAALVQVGELLVELQADSQQAAGALDAEPTGAEDHQSMVQLPQHRQQGEHAGGSSAGRCPDETEGILGLETGTPVQEGPVAAATLPRTLPEVSSNFPGFWCPLAVNRGFILPMAAGAAALSTHKKQQQEEANQCADQKQILKDAQERDRRVRFTVPEEEARCQAHFSAAELQQPGDPTPLVVAPAVFPSGDSWGGAGRPSTLAKSAQLQMPQPPAYSRFGAAAFHRPYAGPQGRRQALMSFVAEGGATCFAVPPVPTLDVVDAAAAGDAASGEWSLLEKQASSANVLIIPRRLQHRQGLGRSLSPQPSLQEPELLEQEVREAYINACLAGHADEPWARLDVVGCELLPGSNYAAELEQLSGKLEQQQGAGALQRLLRQLDTEWQHLRHLRQKYAFPQQSGSMLLAPPANPPGLPRGILKHKSSLGEDGTATIVHVPWVQREAVLMETTAASELAAADQQQQQAPLNPGCSSSAAAVPAMCMAAGLDAPPPAPWPAPTDTAATVEGEVAHDTERPLSPRSLELTPGRPLSRGAQLLVRLGTPGAAAKVQQLLASAASGPGPAVGAASIKLVRAVGGSSLAFRAPQTTKGHMSRGARLLAALHGSNAGGMPIPGARARQQIMGPAERFHVRLLPEDRSVDGEQVTVEVGMEGFNILDVSGARTLRKYPLHHISRWSMRGSSLILFTRSPSDVEDRSTTLQGDETTIRSVLDTLTCSCMQMAEMLQSGQGHDGAGQVAANSLNALLKKSKKPALLTADQVEFWHHPEKAGWMHSQGEHIKTWRKRWFVLKQGFLFRFAASDVGSASKPRGIVDLSTVTDVGDGGAATGRPNSIKLSTATGHICYLCENETSQVEWYSALEGAVAKIVKLVAGVDEEEEERGGGHSKAKSWAEQLERTYATVGSASGSRRGGTGSSGGGGSGYDKPGSSSGSGRPQMISIVNYDTPGTGSGSGSGGPAQQGSGHGRSGTLGGCGGDYVTVDYGSIAGANTVQDSGPPADVADSYSRLSDVGGFGGSYASYNQQQQPAHAYSAQQQLQVPAALPAYGHPQQPASSYGSGNLMDAITAPQAAQQAQSGSPWKVHYTAEGRPYFYNAATGVTQWNAPA